jgi:hypothetical protein
MKTITDSMGRTISVEYTSIDGLPYISGFGVDDDAPYNRKIAYTHNSEGVLVEADDAGGRIWSYGYETIPFEGPEKPIPVNLTTLLQERWWLDEDEVDKMIHDLEPRDSTHTVYPLYELRGPGKGIVQVSHVMREKPTSADPDKKNYRLLARQVLVYNDLEALDGGTPVRSTTYQYVVESLKKTGEAITLGHTRPDEELVIARTTETDGERRVVYTYEAEERKLKDRSQFETRITQIQRMSATSGTVAETETFTYPAGGRYKPDMKT